MRSMILTTLAIGLAPPAEAQKAQTVETAHEFLAATSNPSVKLGKVAQASSQDRMELGDNHHVTSAASHERCSTLFQYHYDYAIRSTFAGRTSHERFTGDNSIVVDWAKPLTIVRDGRRVDLSYGSLTFVYPTEDLAARAAFAMEFLRTECDRTRNLAF